MKVFGVPKRWFLFFTFPFVTVIGADSSYAANSCQRVIELLTSPVRVSNATLDVLTKNHFSDFEIVYETRPIVPVTGKFYYLVFDGPVVVRSGSILQESQRHVTLKVGDYQTSEGKVFKNEQGRHIYRDGFGDDYPLVTPETYQRYSQIVELVAAQSHEFMRQFPEIPAVGHIYRYYSNDGRLLEKVIQFHPWYSTNITLQEDRFDNRALVLNENLEPIGYVLPQSWSTEKAMLSLSHQLTLYEFWVLYVQWAHMRQIRGLETFWPDDADAAVFEAGRKNYRKRRLTLSDTEATALKQLVLSGRRYVLGSYDFGPLTANPASIEETLTAAGERIGRLFSRNQIDQVVNHFMRYPIQYTRENLIELLVTDTLPIGS